MASSSVPLVKSTLRNLLTARPGLAGVQFSWAFPGPDKIAREALFFDRTELTETSGQLGNGTRREIYTQYLYACVRRDGNDAQAVEARAYALVAEIEAQLKPPANASLGLGPADGIKTVTVQFAGVEGECYPQDQGWSSEIRCALNVDARI